MSIKPAIALVAVAALSLTSCSAGSEEAAGPSASPPATTASELVIWTDPDRADALAPFGAQYAAATGIEVRIEPISEDLPAAFITAEAGSTPDVLVGPHDWIGSLVQNTAIDPVPLAEPTLFSPAAVEAVTYNGQTYATPYAVENLGLICNTDLIPSAPTTVEDLVRVGQQLVDEGKVEQAFVQQVAFYVASGARNKLGAVEFVGLVWEPLGQAQAAIVGDADPAAALAAAADEVRQQLGG